MNYVELLKNSFEREIDLVEPESTDRFVYLSRNIFNFITYDEDMAKLFAQKAVDVCKVIMDKTTFDYIQDADNYQWYLLMVNMPFFVDKLDWGGSIRGAWWDSKNGFEFRSLGLWDGDKQLADPIKFTRDEWVAFIKAIVDFANEQR